jgi:hypothetical protein
MGEGFRVFSRFFPFVLFFLLVPVGLGLQNILSRWRLPTRVAVLTLLLALVAVEYYPWHMNVSQVKSFPTRADGAEQLDRDQFVLVLPDGPYRHVHDTYQIAMDMRFVYLSQLTRFDSKTVMGRARRFPMVYGGQPVDNDAEFWYQLDALGVGYVLLENKAQATRFPVPGSVVLETDDAVLMRLGGSP